MGKLQPEEEKRLQIAQAGVSRAGLEPGPQLTCPQDRRVVEEGKVGCRKGRGATQSETRWVGAESSPRTAPEVVAMGTGGLSVARNSFSKEAEN